MHFYPHVKKAIEWTFTALETQILGRKFMQRFHRLLPLLDVNISHTTSLVANLHPTLLDPQVPWTGLSLSWLLVMEVLETKDLVPDPLVTHEFWANCWLQACFLINRLCVTMVLPQNYFVEKRTVYRRLGTLPEKNPWGVSEASGTPCMAPAWLQYIMNRTCSQASTPR